MVYGLAEDSLLGLKDRCALFGALSDKYLLELEARDAIRTYVLEPGESVRFRGGTGKDSVFLVRGEADFRTDGGDARSAAVRDRGCKPLELAADSVVELEARSRTTLCRTDRDHIDYLIGWTTLIESLEEGGGDLRARLASLRDPAVLMKLPFDKVEEAFRRMRARPVKAGEEVIRQGDLGDYFYIIEFGRAEVWQQGLYDDEPKRVAELGKGSHFGEEALVSGGTRNATVRMVEDGRLLCLGKADFDELIRDQMVQEVEAPVARALIDSGHRVIDVRYPEEFEDGHLPDVTLIPLPELRRRIAELPKDGKYLIYCLSGKRSAVAAMIMRQHGLHAVCLKNGLRDWPEESDAA